MSSSIWKETLYLVELFLRALALLELMLESVGSDTTCHSQHLMLSRC